MNKKEIQRRLLQGEKEFDIIREIVRTSQCSYSAAHDAVKKAARGISDSTSHDDKSTDSAKGE